MNAFKSMVLGAIIGITANCQKNAISEEPIELNVDVERAEDIEIVYSDSAQIKVKITGPTMLYHLTPSEPKQEFPDGLNVEFYDIQGDVSSVLTARYGIRYERRGRVIVKDSVVWKSLNQEMIETEELIWNERNQKISTKKFARITKPDEIIYGYGFEADQNFKNARINAITGRLKLEELEEGKDLE